MNSLFRISTSIACFLLILGFGVSWTIVNQSAIEHEKRLLMSDIVRVQASAIERRISHSLSAAYMLALEVKRGNGSFRNFEAFSKEMLNAIAGISSVQLAPDAMIQYIYPTEGTGSPTRLNILKDSTSRKYALAAIEQKELMLGGPFELVQGGTGVIGRYPIFIGEGENEKFWGFSSVLITMEDLLSVTELDQLAAKGYSYQLHASHPDKNNTAIFAHSSSGIGISNKTHQVPVSLPNAVWTLTMSRTESATEFQTGPGYLISFIVALMVSLGLFLLLRQTETLRLSKQQAVDASQAKGAFLADMSHEIRTPLNGILGVMRLLENTDLNSDQKRYLKAASSSSKMLLTVINDILDLSKIEAGKLVMESEAFELIEVVEDTANLLVLEANAKGLELICRVDPDTPYHINGDPLRLRQILSNLLNNAIKFTAVGNVEIFVRRHGETLRIGVADTGVGMSPQEQCEVIKPYTQIANNRSRKSEGTGLGLQICSRMIENMGSRINIESVPGKGSCLSFELKIDPNNPLPYQWNPPISLIGLRVLILSRCSRVRASLEEILVYWQMTEVMVSDIESDETGSLSPNNYDLLIIDQKNGDSIYDEILFDLLKNSNFRTIRLIPIDVLPAEDTNTIFIHKPFRLSQLFQALIDTVDEQSFTPPKTVDALKPATLPTGELEGFRILLVEDNDINRMVADEMLETSGVSLDFCENGREAIAQVQRAHYDLVLMDIQMPVMDGFETTRIIRDLKGDYTTLPIIAMTAHALDGESQSLEAGMDDYIVKPFDPEFLVERISYWLKPDVHTTRNRI